MDDRDARLSCCSQHRRDPIDELIWRLGVDRYNAGLAIHCKDGGMSDIEGRDVCHSSMLSIVPLTPGPSRLWKNPTAAYPESPCCATCGRRRCCRFPGLPWVV